MQLARAEGGRLRLDAPSDLRMALRIVVEDMQRMAPAGRVTLSLPQRAAMSDLDPDVLGIVARNLIENALRHGDPAAPVAVTLTEEGALIVANDGPAAAPDVLARLTGRFERANAQATGSGLGLAIVAAIAERVDGRLSLISPRPGHDSGFEARFTLPHAARTG